MERSSFDIFGPLGSGIVCYTSVTPLAPAWGSSQAVSHRVSPQEGWPCDPDMSLTLSIDQRNRFLPCNSIDP